MNALVHCVEAFYAPGANPISSRRREVELGLATMCIGVGQGIAMVVERAA